MELTYDVIINTDGARGSAKELEAIFKKLEASSDKGAQSLGQYGKSLMSDFQQGKMSVEEFVRELDKLKSKAVEISVVGDSLDVSKQSARAKESISDLLDHITKSEQYALSAIRQATNDFMSSSKEWFRAKDWGFSDKQINEVIDSYEAGEISAEEFLGKVQELQESIEKGLDAKKVIDQDTKSLRRLNDALKQVAKNQSIIDKAGGKKEDKAETPEKAGKKLSNFANIASKSFGGAAKSIARAFSGGVVGAAFIALFAYFKGLLKWNKTLIGLKWGDFKDQMKVMFGYMKEEDAITASIKRRTDAINEETKALVENVKAQKEANAPLAKARAIMERKSAVNEAFKNIVGDREFHFFGGARAKDIQDVLNLIEGAGNKKAVKRYFEVLSNDAEIEKMSQKQLDDMQFELERALQLSDKQKEINEALAEWNKVKDLEEDAYGAVALQQIDAKNKLEKANKAYDDTLKYYQQIEAKRKKIEGTLSQQTLGYEIGDLRQKMSNLGLQEIGGADWAALQSAIDNLEEASKMRGDNRGWTLKEYDRLLDKKKKNIEISGEERKQTKQLGAEIDTLTAKINYLNGNGVKSRTQRLMTEALELEKRRLEVERENTAYKEQSEILGHILGLKQQENTIRGLADAELRNIDLEIENIQTRLSMLGAQKNISAEEHREMGTLNSTLLAKMNERQNLALKKHNDELERQASIQQRLLSIEKERNRLYDNRNGRTDEEIEHDELRINVQMAEEDLKLAQQKVDALQAQKEQYEESEDAIRDGVQWTHEEQKALEEAELALQEKTVALQAATDAEKNHQGVVVQAIDVDKQRVDALHAMADGFSDIGSAISDNLGNEKVGDVADAFADLGNVLVDVYGKWKAGDKVTAGDKVNAISKGVEFVAGQASGIVATHKRLKESAEAWKQSVADVAHEYTMIKLADMEYKQQNVFGVEDPYKRLADNAKKYEAASKATRQALEQLAGEGMVKVGERAKEDWGGVMGDALAGAAAGAGIGGIAGGGAFSWAGAGIGAAAGFVSGFITGIFKDKEMVDVFDTLQNKFGEVFDKDTLEINDRILASYDQLDDKTKKLVDNYKELKEKMDEAKEEFKEFAADMFGDIGNALAESLLSAFRNDDLYQSVHDFHDYVKQQMETLISSKIYNAVFGRIFDNLDSQIESLMANFNRGENVDFTTLMADLPYQTEQLVSTYGALMKQVQEASRGTWDFFQPDSVSQDALKGSIASMSEDTASKLNGNFMGLKLSAMEINTKMSSVRSLMEENQSIMGRSLSALHQIADNTAHLLRIDESIEDMRNEMINNGVRVR